MHIKHLILFLFLLLVASLDAQTYACRHTCVHTLPFGIPITIYRGSSGTKMSQELFIYKQPIPSLLSEQAIENHPISSLCEMLYWQIN